MPDFLIRDHGQVVQFRALTDEAKRFADQYLAVPAFLGTSHEFTTDHGPAQTIVEMIENEGLHLKVM